jgi:hypothetical protein
MTVEDYVNANKVAFAKDRVHAITSTPAHASKGRG